MKHEQSTPDTVPVFAETLGGSLIDAARISVMGALALLPPPTGSLIITADSFEPEQDPSATVHGCLEQAMQWLDAARVHTIADGAPVTSLHTVTGGRPR